MEDGQLSKISKSPNCKCVLDLLRIEVIFLDRTWLSLEKFSVGINSYELKHTHSPTPPYVSIHTHAHTCEPLSS